MWGCVAMCEGVLGCVGTSKEDVGTCINVGDVWRCVGT